MVRCAGTGSQEAETGRGARGRFGGGGEAALSLGGATQMLAGLGEAETLPHSGSPTVLTRREDGARRAVRETGGAGRRGAGGAGSPEDTASGTGQLR